MSPFIEVIQEMLLLFLGFWLLRNAYVENKGSSSFSIMSDLKNPRASEVARGFRSMLIAGGVPLGLVMIILVLHKIFTCGVVCGKGIFY
jgi:hypothetical protein